MDDRAEVIELLGSVKYDLEVVLREMKERRWPRKAEINYQEREIKAVDEAVRMLKEDGAFFDKMGACTCEGRGTCFICTAVPGR